MGSRNKQAHSVGFIDRILETVRIRLDGGGRPARRSTRIPCLISVTLTSLDQHRSFSEPCQIILISLHGCTARFGRPVDVGARIQLDDLCIVTKVTARVVNCILINEHEKLWLLGLELDEPGNVWGVQRPPEDWVA